MHLTIKNAIYVSCWFTHCSRSSANRQITFFRSIIFCGDGILLVFLNSFEHDILLTGYWGPCFTGARQRSTLLGVLTASASFSFEPKFLYTRRLVTHLLLVRLLGGDANNSRYKYVGKVWRVAWKLSFCLKKILITNALFWVI